VEVEAELSGVLDKPAKQIRNSPIRSEDGNSISDIIFYSDITWCLLWILDGWYIKLEGNILKSAHLEDAVGMALGNHLVVAFVVLWSGGRSGRLWCCIYSCSHFSKQSSAGYVTYGNKISSTSIQLQRCSNRPGRIFLSFFFSFVVLSFGNNITGCLLVSSRHQSAKTSVFNYLEERGERNSPQSTNRTPRYMRHPFKGRG